MDQVSVFFEEWLRSLREQYKYVVRKQDAITLPTLTAVMQEAGFSEAELTQLRLEATMHVDDVGGDFVADMKILDPGRAHPADCLCPDCVPIDESQFDDEGQPLAAEAAPSPAESGGAIRVGPIPGAAALDDAEPLTFEDSAIAESDDAADADDAALDAVEGDDVTEADPDAPLQMDLF